MKTLEEYFIDLTSNYPKYYVESYNAISNAIKALEIIKENKIEGLTLQWDGKWWTICVPNYPFPIAYGRKKEEYDLLKEVLL